MNTKGVNVLPSPDISMAERVVLAPLTSWGVGGYADMLVAPDTAEEVRSWIINNGPCLVMGGGSNLLVSDAGVRGTVMRLERCLDAYELSEQGDYMVIEAEAGVPLRRLVNAAARHGAEGLAFANGLPGTLGGALIMNAGAMGGEIGRLVRSVSLLLPDGESTILTRSQCRFGYRKSEFPAGSIIVAATLTLPWGDAQQVRSAMREVYDRRQQTQPLNMPSAGSVFKNPAGDHAGRLIEATGLKGLRIGSAEISTKHANFILNRGGASATDIFGLIKKIEREVFEQFGVRLEREVRLIGEFDE